MVSEIKRLAITLLQEEVVLASWGITKVEIEETNLRFQVNGLKYRGLVNLHIVEDGNYEVIIGGINRGIIRLENILSFLDGEIENTDAYSQDLEKWIDKKLNP